MGEGERGVWADTKIGIGEYLTLEGREKRNGKIETRFLVLSF